MDRSLPLHRCGGGDSGGKASRRFHVRLWSDQDARLFPSAYSNHTVAYSTWRDGKGDVVREFVQSCRALGTKASLYLSPWDRFFYNMTWRPEYNEYYSHTLEELTTRYGPIYELWWDGANAQQHMTHVDVFALPPRSFTTGRAGTRSSSATSRSVWAVAVAATRPGFSTAVQIPRGDRRSRVWARRRTGTSTRPRWSSPGRNWSSPRCSWTCRSDPAGFTTRMSLRRR